MKKVITTAMITIGFLFSSSVAFANSEDELNEQKQSLEDKKNEAEQNKQALEGQLNEVEADISALQKKVNELEEKIKKTMSEIDVYNEKIKETEEKIHKKQEEIKQTEIKLEEKKKILAKSIRKMYMKGDTSYMEFLFRSEDISEFLYRFDSLKEVSNANKLLYEEVRELLELLQTQKQELEEEKEVLQAQKAKLETLKVQQEKDQQAQLVILKELHQKQDDIHKHMEQEQREIDAAQREIEQVVRQIQEERERKRREAEERKNQNDGVDPTPDAPDLIGSGFRNPMNSGTYYLSSRYGWRTHPISGHRSYHGGNDLAAPYGTPIYASDSGTVLYSGPARGFGNWIVIDHNNGYLSVYGHMYSNQLYVSPGQQVSKGQNIAGVGSSGQSTGAHLHFEIHKNSLGNRVDPNSFISF